MINYELLKDAYAIFGGIPEKAFYLDAIMKKKTENIGCGTIACGMGWLSLHPKFNSLGLSFHREHGDEYLLFNGENVSYRMAASRLFGITGLQAGHLFGCVGIFNNSEYRTTKSHKKILLSRIKNVP